MRGENNILYQNEISRMEWGWWKDVHLLQISFCQLRLSVD